MQWLKSSRDREWLEADGTGSFSSLTDTWENRRKYHSLLTVSQGTGFSRRVVLQNLLFDWRPFSPTLVNHGIERTFRHGDITVSLLMPRGGRSLLMKIKLAGETELVPVVNNRSIYDVLVWPEGLAVGGDWIELSGFRMYISSDADIELQREKAPPMEMHFDIDAGRRESCRDEAFTPASFRLTAGQWVVAFGPERVENPGEAYRSELERRRSVVADHGSEALSTEAYLLEGGGVIAGYHWFSQWGRDAMISLPGLTFPFGRHSQALESLRYFASLVNGGMFPNAMDERTGEWSYNTVDAGLWFVNRLYLYWKITGDDDAIQSLLPAAASVTERTLAGEDTRLEDGVVRHPPQWTWMDATGSHGPYVARDAAVEVQALAYSALRGMEEMFEAIGRDAPSWMDGAADEMLSGFRGHFLADGLVKDTPSSNALRPNTLYVMYFPHTLISPEEFSATFGRIDTALTTDFGLRTLDPQSEDYRGTYLPEKDSAYHNGTVWPFIAGAAARAYVKVMGDSPEVRAQACNRYLSGILEGLYSGGRCPGHIAEILDGDSPHIERGCIAQAWSLAEPLWAQYEIMGNKEKE